MSYASMSSGLSRTRRSHVATLAEPATNGSVPEKLSSRVAFRGLRESPFGGGPAMTLGNQVVSAVVSAG